MMPAFTERAPFRAALLIAAVVSAVLAVFPQEYAAQAKVVPPQSSGSGLGSLLGSGGGLASLAPLLGSRQPTEVFLAVAKSHEVAVEVARRIQWLEAGASPEEEVKAIRKLRKIADVNALKGGLIEFQITGSDPAEIIAVTGAYAEVFSERLKTMSLQEATKKQDLMQTQLVRASERLVKAQEAMRVFRVSNKLVAPEGIVASAINLSTNLRARLMAKEVELSTLSKLMTPQNIQYKNVASEVSELRSRVASLEAESNKDSMSYSKLSSDTTEYISLLRDQRYAEALFEVFTKYHESLLLEQASAGLNAQVVEAPHLVAERRVKWPFAMLCVVFLAALLWPLARPLFPRSDS